MIRFTRTPDTDATTLNLVRMFRNALMARARTFNDFESLRVLNETLPATTASPASPAKVPSGLPAIIPAIDAEVLAINNATAKIVERAKTAWGIATPNPNRHAFRNIIHDDNRTIATYRTLRAIGAQDLTRIFQPII